MDDKNNRKKEDDKVFSGVALGLSIGGWVLPFIGIALFIAGLVMGMKQRKKDKSDSLALAAIVVSIVGLVVSLIVGLLIGIFFFSVIMYSDNYEGSYSSSSKEVRAFEEEYRMFDHKIEIQSVQNGTLSMHNFENESVVLDEILVDGCERAYNVTLVPQALNDVYLEGCNLRSGRMTHTSITMGTQTFETSQMVH